MPSVYWHEQLQLLLIIYVDDFKMSGKASRVVEGWKRLRKHIKMGNAESALRGGGDAHLKGITARDTWGNGVRHMGKWAEKMGV